MASTVQSVFCFEDTNVPEPVSLKVAGATDKARRWADLNDSDDEGRALGDSSSDAISSEGSSRRTGTHKALTGELDKGARSAGKNKNKKRSRGSLYNNWWAVNDVHQERFERTPAMTRVSTTTPGASDRLASVTSEDEFHSDLDAETAVAQTRGNLVPKSPQASLQQTENENEDPEPVLNADAASFEPFSCAEQPAREPSSVRFVYVFYSEEDNTVQGWCYGEEVEFDNNESCSEAEKETGKNATQKKGRRTKNQRARPTTPSIMCAIPEADDCVWEHRIESRRKEVDHLRNNILDKISSRPRSRLDKEVSELLFTSPDPTDRTVSRRAWRRCVEQWYKGVLQIGCPEEGPSSVASTEEWTVSTQTGGEAESSFSD